MFNSLTKLKQWYRIRKSFNLVEKFEDYGEQLVAIVKYRKYIHNICFNYKKQFHRHVYNNLLDNLATEISKYIRSLKL